jgi:hypothetical protein
MLASGGVTEITSVRTPTTPGLYCNYSYRGFFLFLSREMLSYSCQPVNFVSRKISHLGSMLCLFSHFLPTYSPSLLFLAGMRTAHSNTLPFSPSPHMVCKLHTVTLTFPSYGMQAAHSNTLPFSPSPHMVCKLHTVTLYHSHLPLIWYASRTQ